MLCYAVINSRRQVRNARVARGYARAMNLAEAESEQPKRAAMRAAEVLVR